VTRPLYADCQAPATRSGGGHAGLWYDKFCDRWRVEGGAWSLAQEKLAWIAGTAGAVGQPTLIQEVVDRQLALVEARKGQFGVFVAESRFVTGTGRSHPVENGFVWHPTLGTPYLPGSSIKGLMRSWAVEAGESGATIAAALGPDGRDEHGAGRVVVFDALPAGPLTVEADVLTPHYANWTEDEPPADWRSPTPIPFLVTAAGATLVFSLAPTDARSTEQAALVELAWGWLKAGLAGAGAGAKTAVGYGRFAWAEAASRALRGRIEDQEAVRRRDRDRHTPEGRWRNALEGESEVEVVALVRTHLKTTPIADLVSRRAFAAVALALPLPDAWRQGRAHTDKLSKGSVPGADKLKELYRLLMAAKDATS